MLELGIDTIALDAHAPDAEALQNGAPPLVVCQVIGGSELPFAAPGQDRPMKFPTVAVSYSLTKDAALRFATLVKEHAEALPDERKSGIVTAQSLQGVEQIAQANQKFRG
jgi:hypothetical protein